MWYVTEGIFTFATFKAINNGGYSPSIYNTLLGYPLFKDYCLIKTLLKKNPVGKNHSEGKRVQYWWSLNGVGHVKSASLKPY